MVSKISQGGYGTVYRGVLETWLLRSVDSSILWSISFTSTHTQEPKVDRAGGAFQAGVSVIAVVGLECKRESREFKMNIKKGPETLLAGEMMTGN